MTKIKTDCYNQNMYSISYILRMYETTILTVDNKQIKKKTIVTFLYNIVVDGNTYNFVC